MGCLEIPFPLTPGATVTQWAGRPDEKAILTDIVYTPRSTDIGSSEFAIIHGDYGNGKSHSMRYFQSLIRIDPEKEFNSVAIYVPTTKMTQKVSFLRLYEEILGILGDQQIREIAAVIKSRFISARSLIAATLTTEQHVAGEGQEANLEKRVFEQVEQVDQAMLRLMLRIASEDDTAIGYLRGSRNGIPEIGLPNPVNNDFVAAKTLGALFRVFTLSICGQPPARLATYLLLDEVESILDDRQTDLDQFFQGIRNLVNELPYNFCLLMSFSADTALLEAVIPQAILQRMTRNNVELPALEPDDAKEFLVEVLRDNRPEGFGIENPFHPFAEEIN